MCYFIMAGDFTAIFPGKSREDAIPHLEKFRKSVQDFPFVVRGKDRPKTKKKVSRKRKTTQPDRKKVQIAVSIGVTGSKKPVQIQSWLLKTLKRRFIRQKNPEEIV